MVPGPLSAGDSKNRVDSLAGREYGSGMESWTTDYARIESAIRFIESRSREQPDLKEIASHLGLSPHHFQRLFSRWAGVSPKKFLEFLTVESAKRLLEQSASVLDASLELGLSGPSRLHDMFVQVEAMSPGEYKSMARGLSIRWGICPSPLGDCLIAESPRGICGLEFLDSPDSVQELEEALGRRWAMAALERDDGRARELGQRIFAEARTPRDGAASGGPGSGGPGSGGAAKGPAPLREVPLREAPLRVLLKGSDFQIQVWKGLLSIPEGRLVSYGSFAASLGMAGSARAVGTAIGNNPIGYLIPCHRVLRSSGEFGGYKWGLERKKALIALEASRALQG